MSASTRPAASPASRAAALWIDATEPAADHRLAALHGSSPDVGIAGYSLGGGIGWYARKLGLASNSLTAVELVTADGEHVRADATQNVELFWALRGGGGNFGVVTALEFRLYPIETAYAGMLVWDRDHAERVLRRWADWAPEAPDAVTTSFRFLDLPPLPTIPEPLRGRSLVVIDGAVLGCDAEARSILGMLRGLGPEIDTFDRVPARSLTRLHMDPEGPTPAVSDGTLIGELGDATVDTLLEQVGPGSTSSLLSTELRQLGGALGRAPEGHGALATIDAAYAVFAVAVAATPEMAMQGQLDAHPLTRLARAVVDRPQLPQLRRERGRRAHRLHRVGVAAAQGDPVGVRPRRPLPRQPPRPPALRGRRGHGLTA